ncbi:helix-turn-helix domain-containing protein [Sphingobacterium sp. HJSM2_6]|uniref:helix-turn-helix domain-containing protein n=1 Tax=Sphingobacterium sp. HJSM2_6 TaxID=3366264 RepID=UPI003BBA90ED
MTHLIDLLSIQTPEHLQHGYENRHRIDCGSFEIYIFETFQSSTKVQIRYDGLSISSMIRGKKIIHTKEGTHFEFLPGTTLILPEGKTIYADFPQADAKNPVQCATLLIPQHTINNILAYFNHQYGNPSTLWEIDFTNFHFNNNSALVRTINELLLLNRDQAPSQILNDLLLKSLLVRLMEAQQEHQEGLRKLNISNQLLIIKKYIHENLSKNIQIKDLLELANCSKSTLYRLFESCYNKSPGEYILEERMALAKNLLLSPNSNISQVAFLSGFSSVSYFSRMFKQIHQTTPGDFIKKFRYTD